MHVEYAQLPPPEDSADRIFITDNAVIVLDGATAFGPSELSAQTYADHLGNRLVDQLTPESDTDLSDALATAIEQTSSNLDLHPCKAPSSTVAILRQRTDAYDVLVLGDSIVLWGAGDEGWGLVDDRLDRIGGGYREEYQARLRAGHGYDDHHGRILESLQAEQRKRRNTHGGYWIAEASPFAARNALITTIPRTQFEWAVMATDGAFDLLNHQGRKDWSDIATYSSERLSKLLQSLHRWESVRDPKGQLYPRAKRHDDKLVASVRPTHANLRNAKYG